ncbi:MAG: hypothetical protein ABUL60_28275 [Myxococcales bacterium]
MKAFSIRIASLLPLLLMGCDEAPEPGAKVDSFRVLAEQVDQPYAHPGETVKLSSLSFDPQQRPVTWAWASCVNPEESSLEGCIAKLNESPDPAGSVFAMGEGADSPELVIPADVLTGLPAQARTGANLGVVSVACPGDLSLGEGPGGLPFRCQEVGSGRDLGLDEFIAGIKRVTVRETDRNLNPVIARITFDGVDWPADEVKEVGFCNRNDFLYDLCPDKEKHHLAAVLTPESFESGKDELGHDFDEQLVVQYYATEGIFENEVRVGHDPKNGWVARKRASGQTLTLWFVARDNRGGVSWAERRVSVR